MICTLVKQEMCTCWCVHLLAKTGHHGDLQNRGLLVLSDTSGWQLCPQISNDHTKANIHEQKHLSICVSILARALNLLCITVQVLLEVIQIIFISSYNMAFSLQSCCCFCKFTYCELCGCGKTTAAQRRE